VTAGTGEVKAGITAVITARGGSKRLPGKNLRMLGGIPLIAHTIRAAKGARGVATCAVTTDDDEIARVAQAEGAQIVRRPAALATDASSSADAVAHALDELERGGGLTDLFVLLQPTSPLRSARHIEEAVALFSRGGCESLVSVTPAEHHPHKMLGLDKDGFLVPLNDDGAPESPQQLLPPAFRPNGAIYLLGVDTFRRTQAFIVPRAMPYIMDGESSIDIDSALDFELAEAVLARRA
jgi:CMP-N,N'-diacetyllegionaminic acid synthase